MPLPGAESSPWEDSGLARGSRPRYPVRLHPLVLDQELVPMKVKIRNSNKKHAKKTGFRTRQKTAGGRKINKRQRARHGSF